MQAADKHELLSLRRAAYYVHVQDMLDRQSHTPEGGGTQLRVDPKLNHGQVIGAVDVLERSCRIRPVPSVQQHLIRSGSLSVPMRKSSNIEDLAQEWQNVQVVDLDRCDRGAIQGKKKKKTWCVFFPSFFFGSVFNIDYLQDMVLHVVPCSLSQMVSFAW